MVYLAVAAKTVNPRVMIIAVESERGPGFYTSLKGTTNDILISILRIYLLISAGRPVVAECQSTLADGLAVPLVGANAFATAAPLVDKAVCVRLVLIEAVFSQIIFILI